MDNKDLIKQYVDTGQKLPEYQIGRLPSWAAKTYIRKRMIAAAQHDDYKLSASEVMLMDDKQFNQFVDIIIQDFVKTAEAWPDVGVDNFAFKYGGIPNKFRELIPEIPNDGFDNLIKKFLTHPEFLRLMNLETIKIIISRVKDPLDIIGYMGDKGQKFLADRREKRKEREKRGDILYSYYPENMLKFFGIDNIWDLYGDDLHNILWDLANSPVPQKFLSLFGDDQVTNKILKTLQQSNKNSALMYNISANARNKKDMRKIFIKHGIPTEELDKWIF